ncbi:MAG TPA: alpha/beta fold hydrolase [Actinomycetota bacterium]
MPHARSGDARIAYEVAGEGEPLLMIMGFATDARMWMFQLPALTQRFRCITLDNRGVGGSPYVPGDLTLEQMAADARAVLDAEGIGRAHVMGISMGGAIAQHLALDSPDRVDRLILAATWCRANPYLPRMASVGRTLLRDSGQAWVVRASMLWLFTPRFLLEFGEALDQIERIAADMGMQPAVFDQQVEAILRHDTAGRLASLTVPTLVLTGERDIFVPTELSVETAEAIPGAELVVLPGGHAFNVEHFAEFNEAVLRFLSREPG